MKYRVLLIEDEEGFAVGCPALPGCWTQGSTRVEAIDNIRTAICEVLEVQPELEADAEVKALRSGGVKVETQGIEVALHA